MGLSKEQDEFVTQLYKSMYYQLTAYARSALLDRSLAEEAVQDTFRIACSKIDEFMTKDNPQGWLFVILKNVIRNINRELANLSKLFVATLSVDEKAFIETTAVCEDKNKRVEDTEVDILYSVLLAPDEYKLLKLIVLKRYSMYEAAAEFNISVETCKKRIQRTKAKLRKILEKDFT